MCVRERDGDGVVTPTQTHVVETFGALPCVFSAPHFSWRFQKNTPRREMNLTWNLSSSDLATLLFCSDIPASVLCREEHERGVFVVHLKKCDPLERNLKFLI